jgi:hypothetical protein
MHEYAVDRHSLNEWEFAQPWNLGAGSLDATDVAGSRERVAQVEALQRRV